MMITSREGFKIVIGLDSGRIFILRIPDSSSILGNFSIHNIVANITAKKESLMRNNRISSKCRSLKQVQERTGMQSLLSIMNSYFSVFGCCARKESCSKFKFDATSNLIVQFDFCIESINGCPTLSEGNSAISIFSLEFASDRALNQYTQRLAGGIPALAS